MKAHRLLVLLPVFLVLMLASGCKREDKATGPEPILPQGGVRLMFADCDPFRFRVGLQDAITLTSDHNYACNGTVQFVPRQQATWISGAFQVSPGSYQEGYHLAFERDLSDAQASIAVLQITFQGIATQFTVTDTMPMGNSGESLRKVIEVGQTGTVVAGDTSRSVMITVSDLESVVRLNLASDANGSYVQIGADPSAVCELKILYDSQQGITRELPHTFVLLYNHAVGTVTDSVYLDFTHGAHVTETPSHRLTMGDQFGVAYLASEASGCRDSAAFWAIPSMQAYREDTLGFFPMGNILSDGSSVWYYRTYTAPHDSTPCGVFNVSLNSINGTPVLAHPIYNCSATVTAAYDRVNRLIWVIEHTTAGDSAWGYTRSGVLDSVVAADVIPGGFLYQGLWVQDNGSDLLRRSIAELPFTSSAPVIQRLYPAELTEQFGGNAGIGYPGAGRDTTFSINTFNDLGFWTGQFPIAVGDSDQILSVNTILADSVIVYAIQGNFMGVGLAQHVRVLSPH
jgi:hypothetical protein